VGRGNGSGEGREGRGGGLAAFGAGSGGRNWLGVWLERGTLTPPLKGETPPVLSKPRQNFYRNPSFSLVPSSPNERS
jgi:hypothetical protein